MNCMKKVVLSALSVVMIALFASGCSNTAGYSNSDMAKAHMTDSYGKKKNKSSRKNVYTAKDRLDNYK